MADLNLDSVQKRYLAVELAVGAAIVNLLFNMGLGWLILRKYEGIGLWADVGEPAVSGEILGTCLLLPFFTGLIVTPLAYREVRRGRIPAATWRRTDHGLLGRLPRGTFMRSLVVGLACVLIIAIPALVLLHVFGFEWLGFRDYILAKGIFSGLLAAPVTPLFGLCVLGDAERKEEARY